MSILHDPDRARRLGLVLAPMSALAALTGLVLFVAAGQRFAESWMAHNLVGALALAVAFAAMVREQPNNAAVWTLGWAMLFQGLGQALLIGIAEFGIAQSLGPVSLRGEALITFGQLPTWLAWLAASSAVTWIPGVVPLVTLGLLLFPDGRLPSRRWRPAVVLAVVAMVVFAAGFGLGARPRPGLVVGEVQETRAFGVTLGVGAVLTISAVVASVASLVVRYRRSSGDQRRQIRWIGFGGGMFGLAMCLWATALVDIELAQRLFWWAGLIAMPALFASYAVAILRYRLYDIDVVISRSLVVAVLAGFIAAVYVAVVVGVGQLIGVGDEANLGLKVVATAIVAVAFQPLRQTVRRWADGLVYGQRATPYEVLARFSRQAANAGDEDNLQQIAEVLAAGTGAEPAVVWLRVGDHLRPVASSDPSVRPSEVALRDGDLSDLSGAAGATVSAPAAASETELDAALVMPVRHDGELLGAVSITKPRSEPPTPQDEQLAERLASGLALVMRNARLTAELRALLDALEASRQRIVRAQDEARRTIEGDLRHGAHRQLVELETMLALARAKACEAHADRTSALLEQLETEADDAVATLRGLAQGIYPPVLEAEGLLSALTAQVSTSPLPVTVHAPGLPRHTPEAEAAVYFCVLEALQNAAKYAQGSSLHVRLEQRDGQLCFDVTDDGIGFDALAVTHGSGLRGIADRLDTVGGTLRVHSTPGAGTRVSGTVPVDAPQHAVASAVSAVERA